MYISNKIFNTFGGTVGLLTSEGNPWSSSFMVYLVMVDLTLPNIVLQDKNDEEVLAVIAHELGHWKLNHFVPLYVAMQVCVIAFL